MYCTKCLPFVFLALAGCSGLAGHGPAPGIITGGEPLSESADKETNLYRQAITALNNSQLEQAETDLKTIIKERPEFAGPWINLALIDIKKKDLEGAEKKLAKALERNAKMPQIFNALGYIEASRGNVNKALEHFRQAIALKNDYALAHYNLALLQDTYMQDAKVAVEHYKRYLELTQYQDKKTADWVLELERTLARGP